MIFTDNLMYSQFNTQEKENKDSTTSLSSFPSLSTNLQNDYFAWRPEGVIEEANYIRPFLMISFDRRTGENHIKTLSLLLEKDIANP